MSKPIHTEVSFGDFLVLEPVTAVTDWMITFACFYFALKITRNKKTTPFFLFFILQGLSTLFGGIAHGFLYEFGLPMHQVAWIFAGLAVLALQWSLNSKMPTVSSRISLNSIALLQFSVFAVFALQPTATFLPVAINSAVGLVLMVLPVALFLKVRLHYQWTVYFFRGIGILALTGLINAIGFHPFKWFNGNDLAHIIIIASMYLFYQGVNKFSQIQISESEL
jgi:hypothetical protein